MLQDQVLAILERNRGGLVTGGELGKELGVSRTAVWKAIGQLREGGNDIESIPNSGYRLAPDSDGLSAAAIAQGLRTDRYGRGLELLRSVSSTNQYVKGLDTDTLPDGYTVAADEQLCGRGRRGRSFCSPARQGVYMSVFLRPGLLPEESQFLTVCAAVAVCRALEDACGLSADVKWVNDVYVGGKKLCGILTEAFVSAELQSIGYAVVGIGVNTGRVGDEVRGVATSVLEATGKRGIRNGLIAAILNRLEETLGEFAGEGRKDGILAEYRKRMFLTGREVIVTETGEPFPATVAGVDDAGRLLVRDRIGDIRRIAAGEVQMQERGYPS